MKLLLFTLLISISFSSKAIELNSCTDESGNMHYINLPLSSLDSNCKPKDLYSVMLQQDYDNLSHIYSEHESVSKTANVIETDTSDSLNTDKSNTLTGKLKNKISDIFDSDKALDELIQTTEDRDDFFTNAMRGRSKGINNILKQGK